MNERKRLGSWKEIAAHLHVETRTAMRWEHERGLPVHRVPGGGRAAVFAYADEIDAWLLGQPEDVAATFGSASAPSPSESASAYPHADGPVSAPGAAQHPQRPAWRFSRGAVIAVVCSLAVVLFVVFAILWRGGAREVVRVSFAGEKLIAWDAANREVWSHKFPGMLQEPKQGIWNGVSELARLVDLDGDGAREVLALVDLPTGTGREDPHYSELHCFSLDGKPLWHYRPESTLKFRDREFTGPWIIYDYLVAAEGSPRTIWLAVNHHLWWPAFLVKLDAAGIGTVQFVNSGTIYTVNLLRTATSQFLVAGGVNNEPYAAMLAVLDVNQSPAASPQTAGSEFQCQNCPRGRPTRYFVFPPTELNQFEPSRLNRVISILGAGKSFQVETLEVWPSARLFYEFPTDAEILPNEMRFSDGFKIMHDQLEREGKLKHPFDKCLGRIQPKIVRMWTPLRTWENVPVSSSPTRH